MQRIHVCMREPYTRAGGLHSYVRGLTAGQTSLGLKPLVVDRISYRGDFEVASGEFVSAMQANTGSIVEYHFAHGAFPFLYSPRSPWKGYPKIFHFHGPWHREGVPQGDSRIRTSIKWAIEKCVYVKFDRFIVASDFFGRTLERAFGIPPENIHRVYPGIDDARFSYAADSADARLALGIPGDSFVAVIVRRLEPRMGVEDAFMAIKELKDTYLVVAGTGSLDESLRLLAADLGIAHRVKFLGRVSDAQLPLVYQAADVSLVPTRDLEGFGMVVLESMACGTPVISTNVGGLPEAMGPFAARWTVDPHSPSALADKLKDMAGFNSLRSDVRNYAQTRSNTEMARGVETAIASLR